MDVEMKVIEDGMNVDIQINAEADALMKELEAEMVGGMAATLSSIK